jgi:hypothetical protein
MTSREWAELIKPVLPHVSADKELPELQAVRLEACERAVYAIATDRCTLAAERHRLDSRGERARPVHIAAKEAAASLRMFPYSKDFDPPLRVTVDQHPIPVDHGHSLMGWGVTLESPSSTRVLLRDVRDPGRDAIAGWRTVLREAMTRPDGAALDGLDMFGWQLARWAGAARKGERLTVYSGPKPGDPLLVTVEQHFAGIVALQHYLDAPAKARAELPWLAELDGADPATGEKLDGDS